MANQSSNTMALSNNLSYLF